jgi:hypothetical protein
MELGTSTAAFARQRACRDALTVQGASNSRGGGGDCDAPLAA